MSSPLRVGHLVSGGGTTMENVARRMQSGELGDIRPGVVISDRECGAEVKARALGIPVVRITKAEFDRDRAKWGTRIAEVLRDHGTDIVFQNGWVPLTPTEVTNGDEWDIYNQHPGLLSGNGDSDFGGRGMCGTAVTAARILFLLGVNEVDPKRLTTESTIHLVTEEVDEGCIVRIAPHNIAHIIEQCRQANITTIESTQDPSGNFLSSFDVLVRLAQEGLLLVEHNNVARVLADRAQGLHTFVTKDRRATALDFDMLIRAKSVAIRMYPTK